MHLSFQLADLLLGDWRQRGKLNRGGSGVLSLMSAGTGGGPACGRRATDRGMNLHGLENVPRDGRRLKRRFHGSPRPGWQVASRYFRKM